LNKDNLLFAVVGTLIGFVAGFLLKEAMDIRQPPRILPGQAAVETGPAGDPTAGGQGGPASTEVQQLVEHLRENPNDAEAIRRLADLNFNIQNWPRGVELYSRYLELRPGDPNILSDLAVCYRGLGELDQALATLRQAQRVAPEHWQSVYNEIIILAFDLKQFDDADQVLARLKRMQPDNKNVSDLAAEVERQKNAA
jgi:tetratricopeptide (TPR) repeat protein